MTSNALKTYCESVLNLAGWHVFRINAGYAGKWNVKQAPDGTPDIIGYDPNGCFVGLEIKVGRDTVSDKQEQRLQHIAATKYGIARVIRCEDDVELLLRKSERGER